MQGTEQSVAQKPALGWYCPWLYLLTSDTTPLLVPGELTQG